MGLVMSPGLPLDLKSAMDPEWTWPSRAVACMVADPFSGCVDSGPVRLRRTCNRNINS